MDQAASVTSLPTSALYISFFPTFSATPVPLPITPGAVFVVANSLVVSDKVVGARTRYNLRVVETLVAARVLARVLKLDSLVEDTKRRVTLREVLGAYAGVEEVKGVEEPSVGVEKLVTALEDLVAESGRLRAAVLRGETAFDSSSTSDDDDDEGVTMEEMIQFSGLDEATFKETYLSWVDVDASRFALHKRAKHVFSEALRVLQFRAACLSSSSSSAATEKILETLGGLMNASQTSCSTLYDCSCPELDALTALALRSGAYGARLTGAGWGGCAISLVREDRVEAFVRSLREGYEPYQALGEEEIKEVVFVTRPGSGAFGECVFLFCAGVWDGADRACLFFFLLLLLPM